MANNTPLITWKEWQDGIANSPHLGNAMLKAVEIDTFMGAARVGKKPISAFQTAIAQTFTADASTDIMTEGSGTVPNTGTAVTVSNSGGALPTGLSASTNYFIIKISSTTFKLATTINNADAGTAIDISDAGSGTNTVTSVNPGTARHYARDPNTGDIFMQDSNGRVWYRTNIAGGARLLNGNTLTSAAGNGLAVFRVSDGSATYLFAFRNSSIDVVNVLGDTQKGAPSWSNAWQTTTSATSHHTRVGQDNIIYFCNDRYVGSIRENAGQVFAPGTGGTYTYNTVALDLPLGALTYWLEELGTNLWISVSNDSFLYPWDRTSDSYGLPVPIGEYGGNKMKNIGNVLYVLAGTHGNIYTSQGTYCKLFKTLPLYATYNTTTPASNPITWGGIEAILGKLAVGVGSTSSGNSGLYLIAPTGELTIDNQPSTGAANVTAIIAINEFYQMGYASGADTIEAARYNSLGTVILQSPLYRLGNKTQKATISEIEYQIADAVSGNIRLGYRTNINNSTAFTTITTWTTTTSITSDNVDAGLTDIENIQFQVELSGSIDFMELRCFA